MDSHLSKVPKSHDFIQSLKVIFDFVPFNECKILTIELQKVNFKPIKYNLK